MKKIIGSVVFAFFALSSCQINGDRNKDLSSLSHEETIINRNDCFNENCVKVDVRYPEFTGDPEVSNRINQQIVDKLKLYVQFGEFKNYNSLDLAIQGFIDRFENHLGGSRSPDRDWAIDLNGKVTYQTEELISLNFIINSYTGGAHPNSSVLFMNFDTQNGELITNNEIIKDKEKMLALSEKAFREYHNMAENIPFNEDDRFFISDNTFFIASTMGYDQEDFVLVYNSYEIGSYALGKTELKLPLKNLENIVLIK